MSSGATSTAIIAADQKILLLGEIILIVGVVGLIVGLLMLLVARTRRSPFRKRANRNWTQKAGPYVTAGGIVLVVLGRVLTFLVGT